MRPSSLLLVLVCLGGNLIADGVVLKNGDRLTGTVRSLLAGKVQLQTSYAGTIAIAWAEVDRINTNGVLVARLTDGTIMEGTLSSPQAGEIRIAGSPAISLDQISLLGQKIEEVDDPGLLEEWHGAANLGYTLARGNTDVTNLSFSVTPERKTDRDRMAAGFHAIKSTQDGKTASNLYKARFRYEHTIRDRLFAYGAATFEKDEREQLDLRSGETAGFGIRFKPASHTDIALFGGLTFLQETFEGLGRDLNAEGALGFDLTTGWLAPAVLSSKSQYLPLLSQDRRYRLEWEGSMNLPLFSNFSFGISLFDNYDSRPPRATIKQNDFGLLTMLGWKF